MRPRLGNTNTHPCSPKRGTSRILLEVCITHIDKPVSIVSDAHTSNEQCAENVLMKAVQHTASEITILFYE